MSDTIASLRYLSINSHNELDESLKCFGMTVLGGFHLAPEERDEFTRSSEAVVGLIVSSQGQTMWQEFRQSTFYSDQLPNPLNRWTESVLKNLAMETQTGLALPFDYPFPPFQRWAKRATGLTNSPLGIMVHPDYGLWFGLRGVFFFKVNVENQDVNKLIQPRFDHERPCDNCIEKPCLSHCPVNAFDETGLNVKTCFSHIEKAVNSAIEPDCMSNGCAAREACPLGHEYKYCNEQLQFHMKAYYHP